MEDEHDNCYKKLTVLVVKLTTSAGDNDMIMIDGIDESVMVKLWF